MKNVLPDRLRAAVHRFHLRQQYSGQKEQRQRISNPWHAVSIATDASACRAAEKLRETRYLSKEAPALPLAECEHAQFCACRFKHHPDRRNNKRRARDSGFPAQNHLHHLDGERRVSSPGRRATDG